jgi:hypothetical protein
MKTLTCMVISCILLSINSSAAIVTAIQNGNWTAPSTWDAARVPQDNDQVIIPASRTVTFSGSPYPKNTPLVRPTLDIKIYGTLDFSVVGNDKMYLDAGSLIQVFPGGKIQTNTSSSEIIAIYNGSDDNTVWSGSPATINGPANATASTSGFANGVLPVKLESFTIKKDNKGFATLTWITSAEVNSSRFEIERSITPLLNWEHVAEVAASGNTSGTREYHFVASLIQGVNQFRLKQIDIDGKFSYSPVVSISHNADNNVTVHYDQSTHLLLLKRSGNEPVNISVFDVSGHMVYKGTATSQIKFEPASAGVYVVNVVNHHSRVAKKILVY